ncbi:serine hydrolase domain-containing protein [Pseudoduganella buxea]|nr:serine hydrolase domain-containing protein [Pseudoduganella buxea]GGB87927.1 hypothetical protein GCM10011572_07490 [Pseudoduganella buxea]
MVLKRLTALGMALLLCACGGGDGAPAIAALQAEADGARAAMGVPALSVVTVEGDAVTTVVSGQRSMATATAASITLNDRFQMGSQTKAATGMLVARLVAQRRLRWDSTMAELFPAWRDGMQPALRGVTVEQLLRHRGGVQRDIEGEDSAVLRPLVTGDVAADRVTLARHFLHKVPLHAPGTRYVYSNIGYLLAGLAAETAGGAPFEQLMQREVFAPLGMAARLGFPEEEGAPGLLGHTLRDGVWTPTMFEGEERHGMELLAASGGMMASMADYGKLLRAQLQGLRGASDYLDRDAFRRMHGPAGQYGLGWAVTDEAGLGRVSAHSGSWGTYYVFALVLPDRDRAVAVACNCFGEEAVVQADRLALRLAGRN